MPVRRALVGLLDAGDDGQQVVGVGVAAAVAGLARSAYIKQRRRRRAAPATMEPLEAAHDAELSATGASSQRPDRSLERAELGEHLGRAIAALEPMYREVLVMRDVEGLSAAEVGEALGLSVQAVKSRLHRARARVREALAPLLGGEQTEQGEPAWHASQAEEAVAPGCGDVAALLSARLEGELTGESCRQMERHLAACPRCATVCSTLRATLRMCQEAGDSGALPPPLRAAVAQAVEDLLARYDGAPSRHSP